MTGDGHIRIARLFTSRGHNFFGRHGKAAGAYELIEHQKILCVAGCGIEGDRFFNDKENHSGQITFFASEVFDDVCRALNASDKSPGLTRRNVITSGIDLNTLIGKEFAVQGVRFYGVEECRPCYWMDQAIAPGAEAALRNRGGLRAKILTTGYLHTEA
jgi:MOSC domain-containing protein YiiM